MLLAALRGREAEAVPLIEATVAEAAAEGQGIAVTLRALGDRRPGQRPRPLRRSADGGAAGQRRRPSLYVSMWALPELVEAAARTGDTEARSRALERLAETTQPGGN